MTHYAHLSFTGWHRMAVVRTAVIGTGYLGKFHVEKLAGLAQSLLSAICDIDQAHTQELSEKFSVPAIQDYRTLTGKIDAVSIATPTPSHFAIAKFFLSQGVHVFVEKPITVTTTEADQLIAIAEKNNLVLQV